VDNLCILWIIKEGFDLAEINLDIDTKQLDQAIEKAKELKKLTNGMTYQNRLKSPVVWITLTTGLLAILGEWGLYQKIGIEKEVIQHTITFVIGLLVLFGILNSPTNKNSF